MGRGRQRASCTTFDPPPHTAPILTTMTKRPAEGGGPTFNALVSPESAVIAAKVAAAIHESPLLYEM